MTSGNTTEMGIIRLLLASGPNPAIPTTGIWTDSGSSAGYFIQKVGDMHGEHLSYRHRDVSAPRAPENSCINLERISFEQANKFLMLSQRCMIIILSLHHMYKKLNTSTPQFAARLFSWSFVMISLFPSLFTCLCILSIPRPEPISVMLHLHHIEQRL